MKGRKYDKNVKESARDCKYCGGRHAFRKEECPAWGKECRSCRGQNHVAKVCKKRKKRAGKQTRVHAVTEEESDDSDVDYITSVTWESDDVCAVKQDSLDKQTFAEMIVSGEKITFQIDSGASINIVPARHLGEQQMNQTDKKLRMWNGTEVSPKGTARAIVKNPKNGRKYSVEFVIVEEDLTPLIGAQAAQHMKL